MKIVTTLIALFLVSSLYGQSAADVILGTWFTDDKETKIEIYKTGDKYSGKIVWLQEPNEDDGTPKIDDENPDPELQKRPIMGLILLDGFSYNAKKEEWKDGTIYDPKNGKTYDCFMWMEGEDLMIKGFVMGMRFVGRKTTWTRPD